MPFSKKRQAALKHGYLSGLEDDAANLFKELGIPFEYEKHKIPYQIHTHNTWTPDFLIGELFIETKGRWVTKDRMKMRMIMEQHPSIKILMVFSNGKAKISKGSKTTYLDYCNKYKIPCIDFKQLKQYLIDMDKRS